MKFAVFAIIACLTVAAFAPAVTAVPCMQNFAFNMRWVSGIVCDQEDDCVNATARTRVTYGGWGQATAYQEYQCPSTGAWITVGSMNVNPYQARDVNNTRTVTASRDMTKRSSGTFDCGWYGNPYDGQGDYSITAVRIYFSQDGTYENFDVRTTWGCYGSLCLGATDFEQSPGQWCEFNY